MDKQTRGELLVKQEELEKKVAILRAQLNKMGSQLVAFADAVCRNPENVIFSSAPSGLGAIPSHLIGSPSFVWADIPDKDRIAPVIVKLREEMEELERTRRQLLLP